MKIKRLLFIVILLFTENSMSTTLDLAWVRNSFVEAITNSAKAEDLYKKLNETNCNNQPILLAYKGATEGLLAKHSFFPTTKLSYLNKGLENINKAVKLSPENEEIRHIRFNIETSMPSFLGRSVHVEEDKNFLLHFLQTTKINKGNSSLLRQYANTLLNSKLCKPTEVNLLTKIVEQCKQA